MVAGWGDGDVQMKCEPRPMLADNRVHRHPQPLDSTRPPPPAPAPRTDNPRDLHPGRCPHERTPLPPSSPQLPCIHPHRYATRETLRAQKRGGAAFWLYSHEATNCQALVSTVLQSSPEVAKQAVHEAESFYRQNAAALADALGVVGNEVAHRLTQLAASGDRLLHGDGVRARRRRSK